KRWLTFLQNHREVTIAFDFFTVPTVTFQLLYCFFVIEHGRRTILHFNVTGHPTADHVIAFDERHLRRLVRDYVSYYHNDRIHDSLAKDTPNRRPVQPRPAATARVISNTRLGG